MTRETKIGLLVGLAFIIVIGILLSDHLTSTNEPRPATLVNAGPNVNRAVGSPGTVANTPSTITPPEIVPSRVQTVEEVNSRTPNVNVTVGGHTQPPVNPNADNGGNSAGNTGPVVVDTGTTKNGNESGPIVMERGNANNGVATGGNTNNSQIINGAHEPVKTTTPPVKQNDASDLGLGDVAKKFGEELVGPNGQPIKSGTTGKNTEYTAEPGDSLSKIAAKFYGTSTKTGRDAIVAANPALKDNVDKVIVGRKYVIPTLPNVATVIPPTPTPLPPSTPVSPAVAGNDKPAVGEYFYTVSEGDNLYRIATDQLGKASAVAAIKELNKDVLKGEDVLHVGMRLRLPGKPVAKAN